MISMIIDPLWGFFLTAMRAMEPSQTWMYPLNVGIAWSLLMSKWARGNAHWITYFTFPIFWGMWALSKIPVVGFPFGWVVGLHKKVFDTFLGTVTLREVTWGATGCLLTAGWLGGGWLGQYPLYWLVYLPWGGMGLGGLIGFIAEKIGGEAAKKKVQSAAKGSPLYLWCKFRGLVKKPAEATPTPATPTATPNVAPGVADCPTCGFGNPETARRCGKCGSLFGASHWGRRLLDQ